MTSSSTGHPPAVTQAGVSDALTPDLLTRAPQGRREDVGIDAGFYAEHRPRPPAISAGGPFALLPWRGLGDACSAGDGVSWHPTC